MLRWTGLRVSEACALKVSDVDFSRGEIRVRDSKSAAGMRTVPIAPELEPVLDLWITNLRNRENYCDDMPVLATKHGTAMKPQFAWRLVKRAGAKAGVRVVTGKGHNVSTISNHTLRRTFGSHLLNKGMRIDAVSKLLGHQDTRVTERCYAELLPEVIRQEFNEALAR